MSAELRLAAETKLTEIGRLSAGAVAELAGLSHPEFLQRLDEYNVHAFDLTEDEFAARCRERSWSSVTPPACRSWSATRVLTSRLTRRTNEALLCSKPAANEKPGVRSERIQLRLQKRDFSSLLGAQQYAQNAGDSQADP